MVKNEQNYRTQIVPYFYQHSYVLSCSHQFYFTVVWFILSCPLTTHFLEGVVDSREIKTPCNKLIDAKVFDVYLALNTETCKNEWKKGVEWKI